MLSSIFKKKFTDNQLANIFVNGVLEAVDKGFDEVAAMIEEDPAFVEPPNLRAARDGHFTMIVIVANVRYLQDSFSTEQVKALEDVVFTKFANAFDMDEKQFLKYFKSYSSFMSRVNHPSKSVLYSMSKGVFYKYKLNDCQDDYFKRLDCPNPLFLKRMDEIMKHFIWNWEAFFKRYKMVV